MPEDGEGAFEQLISGTAGGEQLPKGPNGNREAGGVLWNRSFLNSR